MLRYIPPFIMQKFDAQIYQGTLQAYVLLLDIADFTVIGTALQKVGKPGAEELSRFLDMAFGKPIEIVEQYGGFVSLFAGDAFCTIFPSGKSADIISAVNAITAFFDDKPVYQTPWGTFNLKVRQTVCYGEVDWQIFINDLQNEYVFYGETMNELANLSHLKKGLVFSAHAASKLGLQYFEKWDTGYGLTTKEVSPLVGVLEFPYNSETKAKFIHPRFYAEQPQNEIRSGAYCFANLESIEPDNRERAISVIQNLADKYGGFVNKYDATDKGLVGIIMFGIPKSEDKTLDRICRFALKAVESIPELALGIASGNVYAGYTGNSKIREYTALGHPMNLAARLMAKAHPGEVLTDHYLYMELNAAYEFDFIGSIQLKGINIPIRNYRLSKKVYDRQTERESSFVGRDGEISRLRSIVDESLKNLENAIIYITGDAGIGKSRLIKEALRPYSGEDCHKVFCYCDAVLPKPLEVIRQIIRTMFNFSFDRPPEAGMSDFRTQWKIFAHNDPELLRIESVIAAMLGYEWPGSVWDMLPGGEKPVQLHDAFLTSMSEITRHKPVLIHLDDAQWIDAQSREYLQSMSAVGIAPVIIITACRYLDDGTRPDLELTGHRTEVLDLSNLNEAGSHRLIESILGLQHIPDNTFAEINCRALGNPFFLEQLVSYLMENGKLNAEGEIIVELGYLSSFSISDIIGSRIDRLTDSLRELVSHASILGMEFNVRVLSAMLEGNLREMLTDGTAHRIWKDLDELRYIFSHILIKDVVYQRMLTEKLQKLHITAAVAMESVFSGNLDEHAEEIALHYEKAHLLLKAAEYFNLAGCRYRSQYTMERAEANLQKALYIREQHLGAEHPDTLLSYIDLSEVYYMLGYFDRTEPMTIRVLEIRQSLLGDEHSDTIQAMLNLAENYHGQGKYALAEPLFLQTLDYWERHQSEDPGKLSEILTDLGLMYGYQVKLDQAETYFLRALKLNEQIYGTDSRITVDSYQALARVYSEQGRYELVEPLCLKALAICERILSADHPAVSDSLDVLGYLYLDMVRFKEAEPLLLRSLDIRTKVMGAEHPDTATAMGSLASLYHYQGLFAQAELLFVKMLEIYEKTLGRDHPETATALNNLANAYDMQGKTELSEPLYLRALAIQEATLEADSPALANTLDNLGVLYGNQKQYDKAESFYLKALAIREQTLGTENPATVHTLNNLAFLYKTIGRYDQAEPLLLKALQIRENILGADHPHTIYTLAGIIELYEKTGATDKATAYQYKLDKIRSIQA